MEKNAAVNEAFQEYVKTIIETKNPSFDLSNFPNASQIDFKKILEAWERMPWLKSVNLSNIDLRKWMTEPVTIPAIATDFDFISLSGIDTLTLDNCGIFALNISNQLANLKILSIRDNFKLGGLRIGKEIKLDTLDLSWNTQQINPTSPINISVYEDFFLLSITTLKCSNNPIFEYFYEENYFRLMNLKVLHADGAGLKQMPALNMSGRGHPLNTLYLQNNEIEDITSLKDLPTLEILNLSNNKIQDITPLSNLIDLYILDLDSNGIEELSPLSSLQSLKELRLSNNPIKKIVPLSILTNLWVLNLNKCLIKADEWANISFLEQLIELRLQNCGIENITFLNSLKKITTLDLRDNGITDILPLINLYKNQSPTKSIDIWDLQNNKIREIEPFKDFDRLIDLNVKGNPVTDYPTERLETLTIAKLKTFFAEPRTEVNSHTKLILFGNSGVGKTNLNSVLIRNRFKDKQNSTDGIEISQWTVKDSQNRDLRVNIWDFGGQEYYHGTHRLFLTQNSVFALLWNKKTNHFDKIKTNIYLNNVKTETELDHFHYDYWLDNIAFYSPKTQNTEGVLFGQYFSDSKPF
jgi:Leucine-rich repeat (LRR) protein